MRKIKFRYIIAAIVLFLAIVCIHHTILIQKCSDITYAADYYTTTGIFNKYKLYKIDSYYIKFSDGHESTLVITGIKKTPPHSVVSYELTLIKSKSGIWKMKNIKEVPYKDTNFSTE
ncbi:hypothetical protein ACJDT4_07970 [Clostridium neuense]|uniref:DUF4878 domain-containing protein n=1 Tax=Clostridium neuense TaxID=1728934 RepID=A0ABW8TCW7_9CLOT